MQTKICTKCGRELPKNIDYFRPKKNRGKLVFLHNVGIAKGSIGLSAI